MLMSFRRNEVLRFYMRRQMNYAKSHLSLRYADDEVYVMKRIMNAHIFFALGPLLFLFFSEDFLMQIRCD